MDKTSGSGVEAPLAFGLLVILGLLVSLAVVLSLVSLLVLGFFSWFPLLASRTKEHPLIGGVRSEGSPVRESRDKSSHPGVLGGVDAIADSEHGGDGEGIHAWDALWLLVLLDLDERLHSLGWAAHDAVWVSLAAGFVSPELVGASDGHVGEEVHVHGVGELVFRDEPVAAGCG